MSFLLLWLVLSGLTDNFYKMLTPSSEKNMKKWFKMSSNFFYFFFLTQPAKYRIPQQDVKALSITDGDNA